MKKVKTLTNSTLKSLDTKKVRKKYQEFESEIDTGYFDAMIERFIVANRQRFLQIEALVCKQITTIKTVLLIYHIFTT